MNVKSIPRMQRGLPKKSPIPSVARVVAVSSAKGGVGKSTTAVNLAISLSRLGRKTGLLDTDLFGPSIPKMMNLCGKPFTTPNDKLIPLLNYGVECMSMGFLVDEKDPVVWRGMMVMKGLQDLIRNVAWNNLDMLVIDMPPGTGDTQLTLSQLVEIDGALIVSTPQDVAMADTLKGIAMFEKLNILGMVQNMSIYCCPNCGHQEHIFGQGGVEDAAKKLGCEVLASVPLDSNICRTSDQGKPISISVPDGVHSKIYLQLARRILEELDSKKENAS